MDDPRIQGFLASLRAQQGPQGTVKGELAQPVYSISNTVPEHLVALPPLVEEWRERAIRSAVQLLLTSAPTAQGDMSNLLRSHCGVTRRPLDLPAPKNRGSFLAAQWACDDALAESVQGLVECTQAAIEAQRARTGDKRARTGIHVRLLSAASVISTVESSSTIEPGYSWASANEDASNVSFAGRKRGRSPSPDEGTSSRAAASPSAASARETPFEAFHAAVSACRGELAGLSRHDATWRVVCATLSTLGSQLAAADGELGGCVQSLVTRHERLQAELQKAQVQRDGVSTGKKALVLIELARRAAGTEGGPSLLPPAFVPPQLHLGKGAPTSSSEALQQSSSVPASLGLDLLANLESQGVQMASLESAFSLEAVIEETSSLFNAAAASTGGAAGAGGGAIAELARALRECGASLDGAVARLQSDAWQVQREAEAAAAMRGLAAALLQYAQCALRRSYVTLQRSLLACLIRSDAAFSHVLGRAVAAVAWGEERARIAGERLARARGQVQEHGLYFGSGAPAVAAGLAASVAELEGLVQQSQRTPGDVAATLLSLLAGAGASAGAGSSSSAAAGHATGGGGGLESAPLEVRRVFATRISRLLLRLREARQTTGPHAEAALFAPLPSPAFDATLLLEKVEEAAQLTVEHLQAAMSQQQQQQQQGAHSQGGYSGGGGGGDKNGLPEPLAAYIRRLGQALVVLEEAVPDSDEEEEDEDSDGDGDDDTAGRDRSFTRSVYRPPRNGGSGGGSGLGVARPRLRHIAPLVDSLSAMLPATTAGAREPRPPPASSSSSAPPTSTASAAPLAFTARSLFDGERLLGLPPQGLLQDLLLLQQPELRASIAEVGAVENQSYAANGGHDGDGSRHDTDDGSDGDGDGSFHSAGSSGGGGVPGAAATGGKDLPLAQRGVSRTGAADDYDSAGSSESEAGDDEDGGTRGGRNVGGARKRARLGPSGDDEGDIDSDDYSTDAGSDAQPTASSAGASGSGCTIM